MSVLSGALTVSLGLFARPTKTAMLCNNPVTWKQLVKGKSFMSRNYRAGQGKLSNSWNWIVIGRLNTLPVAVVAVGGRCCTKQHLYSQQLTQYFFREKQLNFLLIMTQYA